MQIRDDIYPKLNDTPLWTREGELERRIDQAFNTLSTFLETKEEVAKYVNNFQKSDHAELFLDVCSFYDIAKNYAMDDSGEVLVQGDFPNKRDRWL